MHAFPHVAQRTLLTTSRASAENHLTSPTTAPRLAPACDASWERRTHPNPHRLAPPPPAPPLTSTSPPLAPAHTRSTRRGDAPHVHIFMSFMHSSRWEKHRRPNVTAYWPGTRSCGAGLPRVTSALAVARTGLMSMPPRRKKRPVTRSASGAHCVRSAR